MDDERKLRSPWRVGFFCSALVVFGVIGYALHTWAHSSDEAPNVHTPPFSLDVYAASASADVRIVLAEHREANSGAQAKVVADIWALSPTGAKVLLVSTHNPVAQSSSEAQWSSFVLPDTDAEDSGFYTVLNPKAQKEDPNFAGGYFEGEFELPPNTMSVAPDAKPEVIYFNSPVIGENESPSLPNAVYGTGPSSQGGVPVLGEPAHLKGASFSDPYSYQKAGGGGRFADLYWRPTHLTTVAQAVGLGSLQDFDVDSVSPPEYAESGDGLTWSGSTQMHAALLARRTGLAEQDLNSDFLSGIAWATAAAALIALVQEMPDRWLKLPRAARH